MVKPAIEQTGVTGDPERLKEQREKIAEAMLNMKNFEGLLFNRVLSGGMPTNRPTYLFGIRGVNRQGW